MGWEGLRVPDLLVPEIALGAQIGEGLGACEDHLHVILWSQPVPVPLTLSLSFPICYMQMEPKA
jgi:hypothetical protein